METLSLWIISFGINDSDSSGNLRFGQRIPNETAKDWKFACGLRFSSDTSDNTIYITDGTVDKGTGNLNAKEVDCKTLKVDSEATINGVKIATKTDLDSLTDAYNKSLNELKDQLDSANATILTQQAVIDAFHCDPCECE
jgi:hypothetical protein